MATKNIPQNIILILKKHYPGSKIALKYANNWELLVAVVLSAQCTDKMVNKVTEKLFLKYRTLEDYVNADLAMFRQDIKSTGFYNAKAKNILVAAKMIKNDFKSQVPNTMEQLLRIPGVARKTANVILGNAFGISVGVAVDTHVRRLSQRLGLSKNEDPVKIERDLMQQFDQKEWFKLTYLLIEHGRQICEAKKPKCDLCFLKKVCPSAFQFAHFKK